MSLGLAVRGDVTSLTGRRHLSSAYAGSARAVERLASGLRVNRAADDAAGLAIGEGLRSQVGGLRVGLRGAQDAISTLTVADAALAHTHEVLQRLRDLTVRSRNPGTLPGVTAEVAQLVRELDGAARAVDLAGRPLLDGTWTATFQVGAGADDALAARVTLDASAAGLGLDGLGLGGTLAITSVTAGAPDVEPVPGVPSTFTLDVADDAAAAAAVAGLADPATDVTVDGRTVDLTGVTTRAGLVAALGTAGVAAEATADGVRLTGAAPSGAALAVTGLDGTHDVGTTEVEAVSGHPAQVSGRVDLAAPAGRLTWAGTSLNLATLAGRLEGAADDGTRAALVQTALEAVLPGTVAAVAADGTFTVRSAAHVGGAFAVATEGSAVALETLDRAIAAVSTQRAVVGATHNRLEHAAASQGVALEGLLAARSRIVGADMAAESTALARARILAQAATSVLAQAGGLRRELVTGLLR